MRENNSEIFSSTVIADDYHNTDDDYSDDKANDDDNAQNDDAFDVGVDYVTIIMKVNEQYKC